MIGLKMKVEGNIPIQIKTGVYNKLAAYKKSQDDKSFSETIDKMIKVYDKSGAT